MSFESWRLFRVLGTVIPPVFLSPTVTDAEVLRNDGQKQRLTDLLQLVDFPISLPQGVFICGSCREFEKALTEFLFPTRKKAVYCPGFS